MGVPEISRDTMQTELPGMVLFLKFSIRHTDIPQKIFDSPLFMHLFASTTSLNFEKNKTWTILNRNLMEYQAKLRLFCRRLSIFSKLHLKHPTNFAKGLALRVCTRDDFFQDFAKHKQTGGESFQAFKVPLSAASNKGVASQPWQKRAPKNKHPQCHVSPPKKQPAGLIKGLLYI